MKKITNFLLTSVFGLGFGFQGNKSYSQYLTPGKGSSVKQYKNSQGEVVVEQYNIDYLQGGSRSEKNNSDFEKTILTTGAVLGAVYLVNNLSKARKKNDYYENMKIEKKEKWWEEKWWNESFQRWLEEQSNEAEKYFGAGDDKIHETAKITSYRIGKIIPFGEKAMWFDKKLSDLLKEEFGEEWWEY